MDFCASFFESAAQIARTIDRSTVTQMVETLRSVRDRGGRVFVIGSGGGAGHASHAVCDLRKLCEIEAYCPTDNVSELTARINDEGWEVSISNWLKGSRLSKLDCLLVFSVGGGDKEKNISVNLIKAIDYAKECGSSVLGVVGRNGGYTAKHSDACVVVPTVSPALVTPLTESFQAVVWHLLVSHPRLQRHGAKWESTAPAEGVVQSSAPESQLINVKIFADGADKDAIIALYQNKMISGFTTNPTLMRKAGISDYKGFALDLLSVIKDRPISFEVFSDDFAVMESQAKEIASWGENVYVKIPITNTKGQSAVPLIGKLSKLGVKVNVTAIMTLEQVAEVVPALQTGTPAYVSVFAGRIADAGRDPLPIMRSVMGLVQSSPWIEVIWASPRELLNIVQASELGCHIITVTNDILKKLPSIGKDLNNFSLETVKMFYDDAQAAGFSLPSSLPGTELDGELSEVQIQA